MRVRQTRSYCPAGVRWAVYAIAAGALTGTPLESQEAHRGGFWASGGVGYATLTAGCATCEEHTYRPGGALYVRAGGTPAATIRLGGEVAWLFRNAEASSVRLLLTTLIAHWHPAATSGFYLQAGYGLALGRQDYTADDMTTRVSHGGTGLVLGLGWDVPIGRVVLAPLAAMYVGALGDIEARDPTGASVLLKDAIGTGYQIGISVGSP